MVRRSFPAAGNFESVKQGNVPERAALFFLTNPSAPATTLVQLACGRDQLSGFAKSEETPFSVKGKLFAAYTGIITSALLSCE